MKYKQLIEGSRYQISLLIGKHFLIINITKEIGIYKSAILIELKRNQIGSRYSQASTHQICQLI